MLTMSLKYSVFKTDPFIFLPKRCCVFYLQIKTLRLFVSTLKTLSRTKVETEYVFEFAKDLNHHKPDPKVANLKLPPLLRFYLKMGAKVSGTAIFDFDLQTTHVFTLLNLKRSSDLFFNQP